MKKLSYLLVFILVVSCTSNTIFKKPKDLISKDSMSLLIQEMMIASSSKNIKNKYNQKKIMYMACVYDVFKIDSLRFQKSNLYYMSEIEVYEEILTAAHANLEKRKKVYKKIDSLQKDSIKKAKKPLMEKGFPKNYKQKKGELMRIMPKK